MNSKLTVLGATIAASIGTLGSVIAYLLGGWDTAIQTLVIFMLIDYITGIMLAILNKSDKSPKGGLSSKAGLGGIFKKFGMILCVILAHLLDVFAGTDVIKNGTIIVLIANEGLSIVENLGVMGVPVPKILINFIEVLKNKDKQNTEVPDSDEEHSYEESEAIDS